jgi:2-polyprenyl-3-methyl-5-hydroxy-6-metoxy-1,4-benzoquinol methylase
MNSSDSNTQEHHSSVDYAGHTAQYKRLRQRGAIGWSTSDEYSTMLGYVLPVMRSAVDAPRVLEIGSGAGNFSILLAQAGYDVSGLEISDVAVEWAKENALAAGVASRFFVGNVTQDLAQMGPFDQVIDGHCLHCIIGDDRARCLNQVWQALTVDGTFVVLTMCGEVLGETLRSQYDPKTKLLMANGRPIRYIGNADDICAEIQCAGFEIQQVVTHPRISNDDQDDLVVVAKKRPSLAMSHKD